MTSPTAQLVDVDPRRGGFDPRLGCEHARQQSPPIDTDLEALRTRPLEGEFPYAFADATYIKARVRGRVVPRSVVIATGVRSDGTREVLGIDIGDSDAEAFWTGFRRSLRVVTEPGVSNPPTSYEAASPPTQPTTPTKPPPRRRLAP